MQLAGRQPGGCGGISVLSSAPKELGLQLFEGETARCFKAIYLRVPDLVDLSRDTGALRGFGSGQGATTGMAGCPRREVAPSHCLKKGENFP